MNISDRLKTVASLITAGNSVADIGTDHGYIPIYLALNDLTKKAVAMDINEGPLSRAADNIQKYNVGSCVETRISDGLCGLAENEVDTIVIAGMGGLLINRILEDNMKVALSAKEIILSPHSDVPKVREFLADNGLMVTDEVMVKDEGKYYFVLKAVKGHDDIEEREHDKDMMLAADYVIDMGPKAGRLGGEVVFAGTPQEMLKTDTMTSQYMNGENPTGCWGI